MQAGQIIRSETEETQREKKHVVFVLDSRACAADGLVELVVSLRKLSEFSAVTEVLAQKSSMHRSSDR
jgi:hypothetical protein